jgi:hypothetical protein
LAFCAVFGAVLAASPAGFAQRSWAGADDRYHKHLGLFLRLDGGGGYLKSATTFNGSNGSLSGPAGSFGFSLGGNVIEDLSIFGHLGISIVANPSNTLPGAAATSDSTLNFVSVGPGVNYYFTPYNFYVSGMVLVTRLTTTVNGTSGSTNAGFGAKVAIGKEWWVADHWGIGVAGQFTFGSNQDRDIGTAKGPTWTTITPALAFSASFN